MPALLVSFGVVLVAELGDKSQLMTIAFATRYRALPVLIGITIATAVMHAFSVTAGALVGDQLPIDTINILAAIAFLGFAAWTIRGRHDEHGAIADPHHVRTAIVAASAAFFLAELGDKTMLATIALAATGGAWATWVGATVGMVVANGFAIVAGRQLGHRLPERAIRLGATALFGVFGLVLLIEALR